MPPAGSPVLPFVDRGLRAYHSAARAHWAKEFWNQPLCADDEQPDIDAAASVPDSVHQTWLGGGEMQWPHIMQMASVRYVHSPALYTLWFDKEPPSNATWQCACTLADNCVQRRTPKFVPRRRAQWLRMAHRSDIMRLELLIEHGGIYLDHDAYVLRSLGPLRRCATGKTQTVIAGFEQAGEERSQRKLNNGVLIAARNATFLHHYWASWSDYRPEVWDYNGCIRAFELYEKFPGMAALRADIGPLPRYRTQVEYDEHLRKAYVVHMTGMSRKYRAREMGAFGVRRAAHERVFLAAAAAQQRASTVPDFHGNRAPDGGTASRSGAPAHSPLAAARIECLARAAAGVATDVATATPPAFLTHAADGTPRPRVSDAEIAAAAQAHIVRAPLLGSNKLHKGRHSRRVPRERAAEEAAGGSGHPTVTTALALRPPPPPRPHAPPLANGKTTTWLRPPTTQAATNRRHRARFGGVNMYARLRELREKGFSPRHILDIGANRGSWSRAVHQIWPAAQFLLVEADPRHTRTLSKTGFPFVIALLGDGARNVTMHYGTLGLADTGNSVFPETINRNQFAPKSVRMRTLDALLAAHQQYAAARFDLLKCDVQGAELMVLRGASRTLRSVEVLLLELSVVQYNEGAPLWLAMQTRLAG